MSKLEQQPATRVMNVCDITETYDTDELRPRSFAIKGRWEFGLWANGGPTDTQPFYDAMEKHLDEIALLHNARLEHERCSPEHAAVGARMRDAACLVVGRVLFERFVPGHVDAGMPNLNGEDTFECKAMWAGFQVVDAIDQLAQELRHDTLMLIGNYHQALFGWWRLVEMHGVDAVHGAIGARQPSPP